MLKSTNTSAWNRYLAVPYFNFCAFIHPVVLEKIIQPKIFFLQGVTVKEVMQF
jgi:hypothetical protein